MKGGKWAPTWLSNEFVGAAVEFHDILVETGIQLLEVGIVGECTSQNREMRQCGADLGVGGQDLF